MTNDFTDDIRQAYVVAKNEVRKFLVGKKIILFGLLVLLLEALNLIIPYVLGSGFVDSLEATETLLGNITLFIVIAAILFTATSIVSEFEERTALVLFTKPIRKWSIFLGKFAASVAITVGFLIIIYLFTTIVCLVAFGNVPAELLASLGLAICGTIGISGLAILLSSIAKKGSTASIMTLVTYLLVLSMVSTLIFTYANVETWWMLNDAMSSITNSIKGEIVFDDIMNGIYHYELIPAIELARSAAVMLVWGIVTAVASYFLFKKRDF